MQLIVAEKPAVARDLARVLGVRASGQHWFEGEGRVITWCVGHLVELDEPAAYDSRWRAWRLDTLPMVPAEFRLRASKHAAAQLRAVVRLLRDRRFRSVVNACDAGREGELIFRYVYQFAGGGPPVERLWISSLTDDAIRRGFAALRPAAQFDALADAARSRSEADWLVGMNATRAVTVCGRDAGHTALYSIGRVQTPTLAMLVAREQAIAAFVPRDYWEVRGDFRTTSGARFSAGWRHGAAARLASAQLAGAIVERDRAHAAASDPIGPRVERVRARTVREPPPLLFDLTSLQRTANRRFRLTAARTLEIAQALYERHKAITYPRTDARHLSSDVAGELPGLFAALAQLPDYAAFAGELIARPPRPGRRIVDDGKVRDHHAIIPTARPPRLDVLDRDERRIYDLIVRRFLGAFFPDAELAVTDVWIRVGAATGAAAGVAPEPAADPDRERGERGERGGDGEGSEPPLLELLPPPPDRYFARGRVRVVAGWQEVAGIDGGEPARGGDRAADGERAGDATVALPALAEGQPLDGSFTAVAKQTTPPPRYTEATLLAAMESAGKRIDDDALRAAMADRGLGTPATRAAIIETLVKRGYAERSRDRLVASATGVQLIQALPVASLGSPELTGAWEARLARIARREDSRAAFMADIARYVEDAIGAIRNSPPPPPPAGTAAADGARAFERRRSGGGRGKAWQRRRSAGSPGSGPRTGRSGKRKPSRRSEARRPADNRAARARPDAAVVGELGCPRCGSGRVIAGARGWGCSRWREGCRFVVWFETAGRRLTAAQLRDLVTRGRTRKASFVSERGTIAGRLVLDLAAEGGCARLEPADPGGLS